MTRFHYALSLVLGVLVSTLHAADEKPRKQVKAWSIHAHKPTVVGADLPADDAGDVREFDVVTDKQETIVKRLKKVNIKDADDRANIGTVENYVDEEESMLVRVVCIQAVGGGKECKESAVLHNGDETIYMNNDMGLSITKSEGEYSALDPKTSGMPYPGKNPAGGKPKPGGPKVDKKQGPNPSRKRRAALDAALADAKVIKILYFADKGLINLFMKMFGGRRWEAKRAIKDYLTLTSNEMTMYYQTLRGQGYDLYVEGVATDMNIAIAMVGVEFPPAGSVKGNFAWSQDNKYRKTIVTRSTEQDDGSWVYSGMLIDFKHFIENTFSTDLTYDHALAVTGLDLISETIDKNGAVETTNLLGQAWLGTMFHQGYFDGGWATSIQELDGYLARTASHELAHSLGVSHDFDHDTASCPDVTYIMSRSIFHPKGDEKDTYYKFSSCSASDLEAYSQSVAAENWKASSLLSIDAAFLNKFCDGLIGQLYTMDKQCILLLGSGASMYATSSDSALAAHQNNGYATTCVLHADHSNMPFLCRNAAGNGYYMSAASPGTKCVTPDGIADPTNMCYNGTCMSNVEICGGRQIDYVGRCECAVGDRDCCEWSRRKNGRCCRRCKPTVSGDHSKCKLRWRFVNP